MTEPVPTYTAVNPNKSQINPAALSLAAEIVNVTPVLVERWIQDALDGTIPIHAGTLPHSTWLAYRTAVKAFEISHNPTVPTVPENQNP